MRQTALQSLDAAVQPSNIEVQCDQHGTGEHQRVGVSFQRDGRRELVPTVRPAEGPHHRPHSDGEGCYHDVDPSDDRVGGIHVAL